MRIQGLMVLMIVAGGLALSEPAFARDRGFFGTGLEGQGRDASLVDRRASRMTAAQAAREAQHRYGGGKVLSVDPASDGFHVKLLRDGDVRVVFIADH
ncbi:hypothetical protein DFR24_1473 [Panacagrimonas perspica]|uniref:Uncharacterized protein n=2 Tax=Panacagrimonas perspica TaxID=381431 RepID=A0A4S3K843_9GAMM|nr:hypothetical protein [Panacagrimonas perspica]TDU32085.1 hypothetical protein DFR24_1473 [Panacagrimonas perspica]THD04389.1 hypothetical protein B1810_05110 [Panacagrimonas perspica]